MKIFYGLWVTPHPVPRSSLADVTYNLLIPTSHPKESMKEEGGRRKEKEKERGQDKIL